VIGKRLVHLACDARWVEPELRWRLFEIGIFGCVPATEIMIARKITIVAVMP